VSKQLTGIQIYKYLPKTNCKKCGYPTCLAFAMKVAQKAEDVALCPDLSDEARQFLGDAARPPVRPVNIGVEKKITVGDEVVLFRHEKRFYHPPALVVKVKDTEPLDAMTRLVREVSNYSVERIGLQLNLDGFALLNESGDSAKFAELVAVVNDNTELPLIIMSSNPEAMKLALEKTAQHKPLIYAATSDNYKEMAQLALDYQCPLAVSEKGGLSQLAELSELVSQQGVADIIIDPGADDFSHSINILTQLRRLAINMNVSSLGYPIITFPGDVAASPEEEILLAAQHITKYAGIIVLNNFSPAAVYPLLVLRLNIYTDPQKPIQVAPGVYNINDPKEASPLAVTTNFSLTYFSVAGEVQSSGFPVWLLVCDTEGMAVLTAWAAGKFSAASIASAVKKYGVDNNIKHRSLIIPGYVAVIKGALEEELPGWEIMIGPRDAIDIGNYLKQKWLA